MDDRGLSQKLDIYSWSKHKNNYYDMIMKLVDTCKDKHPPPGFLDIFRSRFTDNTEVDRKAADYRTCVNRVGKLQPDRGLLRKEIPAPAHAALRVQT